jgi:signal transduction histidine kinase/ligand-binding sensor domain-containing protein
MNGLIRFGICLWMSTSFVQAQRNLKFDRLGLEYGLSQSQVFSITQDAAGYIWFATADGLNRFNGYRFDVFRKTDSLPWIEDNFITKISWQSPSRLWIGSDAGGLQCVDFSTELPVVRSWRHDPARPSSLRHDRVISLTPDHDSVMWIGTNAGLDRLRIRTGEIEHVVLPVRTVPPANAFVNALHLDRRRRLWVGTNDGLIVIHPDGRASRIVNESANDFSLNESTILSLVEDRRGRIWVGTFKGGLHLVEESGDRFRFQRVPTSGLSDPFGATIWCMTESHDGRFWIATGGNGLLQMSESSGTFHFSAYVNEARDPFSLSGNDVRTIFEDRSGNLWLGTNARGISKFNVRHLGRNRFEHLTLPDEPAGANHIWSMTEFDSQSMLIGTWGGGLWEMKNNRTRQIASLPMHVWTLWYEKEADRLWLGGLHQPLQVADHVSRYRDLSAVQFRSLTYDSDESNLRRYSSVSSIIRVRDGDYWIGTWGNGIFHLPRHESTLRRIALTSEMGAELIYVMMEDRDGHIWVGTEGQGLLVIDPATLEVTQHRHRTEDSTSLSDNRVYALHQAKDGTVWIGTYGGGLNRWDPGNRRFYRKTKDDGLPNNAIYTVVEDQNGNLWLTTNGGVSRFNPATGTFRNFDILDGLQSNEFSSASVVCSDGQIWLGGINGLNRFNPSDENTESPVPLVAITGWRIGPTTFVNRMLPDSHTTVVLEYPNQSIDLEFTSLDYTQPERNTFLYTLEGFDNAWIESGSRRFASYTNLDGGSYTFRVRTMNGEGLISRADAVLRIDVRPAFWNTWWFRLLAALLLASAGAAWGRYRIAKIHRQKVELENTVADRTAELRRQHDALTDAYHQIQRQKDDLDRTLDELRRTQHQLIESEKMSSIGIMVAGIAHEINNPLSFIYGNLPHLEEHLKTLTSLMKEIESAVSQPDAFGAFENIKRRYDVPFLLEDLQGVMASARNGAQRIKKIIDDLRHFSDQQTTQKKTASIVSILDRAVQTVLPVARGSITVEREYRFTDSIACFETLLEQAMIELLRNAVDAMPGRGQLTLSVNTVPDGSRTRPDSVCITIADTGMGMDASIHARVYDPFFSTKPVGEGIGLGLSMAYVIIQKHQGQIRFDSLPGQGTRFYVFLPRT